MIPRTFGHVGSSVEFKGTAYDFGHRIVAVELSMDNGKTWTTYDTCGTNDYQIVSWRFRWMPVHSGFYVLRVRSRNDEGKNSPEADYAEVLII